MLFFNLIIDSMCCNIFINRNKKLKLILKKGEELLEEELDIIKILKKLRKHNNQEENKF